MIKKLSHFIMYTCLFTYLAYVLVTTQMQVLFMSKSGISGLQEINPILSKTLSIHSITHTTETLLL